ncbi:MAG: DUF2313 domain-containing protein [Methylococcales bacterium]|nr:DUF2313 domain-containing protein [Methylococcales bacterium]
MGLAASDYYNELTQLLPAGPAWDTNVASTLTAFLDAWSQELARLSARADLLISESDPFYTNELLTDYERVFGLPTDCLSGVTLNLQQRHANLISQMTSTGGQTPAYYIALAATAGYTITITEFISPYVWQVNTSLNTVTNFLVTSGVDESLAIWQNNSLECLINRYKPAHTQALFSYT